MKKLTFAQWDRGSIKGLGWSEDEKLIVVTEDGTVRVYADFHGDFTPFNLAPVCQNYSVTAIRS